MIRASWGPRPKKRRWIRRLIILAVLLIAGGVAFQMHIDNRQVKKYDRRLDTSAPVDTYTEETATVAYASGNSEHVNIDTIVAAYKANSMSASKKYANNTYTMSGRLQGVNNLHFKYTGTLVGKEHNLLCFFPTTPTNKKALEDMGSEGMVTVTGKVKSGLDMVVLMGCSLTLPR